MTFVSTRAVAFAKLWLFSFVVAVGLLAPGLASADFDRPFSRIVVFGDSLSDPGNAFALNGGQSVQPPTYGMDGLDALGVPEVIALVPEAPYAGGRFSNGPTWIELLGSAIGLGSSVKPAFTGSDRGASNYAVGGATAFGAGPTDLSSQVELYLRDVRGHARRDALYVIEIGGNDIRAAVAATLAGQDPMAVIDAALASVADNIEKLHKAGARKFLVWNAPDLGRTPALQRLNAFAAPGIAGLATSLSGAYNLKLPGALAEVGGLRNIEIIPFDAFGLLEDVQADPAKFHLANAADACIQPDVPAFGFDTEAPFRCTQPDRFFFWDGIHPTRAGHAVIAFLVGKALVEALQDH